MNNTIIPVIAFTALLLAGCVTTPTPPSPEPTDEDHLRQARILMDSGQHLQALKAFADLRDNSADAVVRQRAVLGVAAALRTKGDTAAAIGALMPLPPVVATELDAQQYAMAGELYLRKKAHETASSYLETALAYKGGSGKWRPAALFNLGKCALALGVPHKAQTLFTEAMAAFDAAGDTAAARNCAAVLADLKAVLPRETEGAPDVK